MPFCPFFFGGGGSSPTKIDYRKKVGALILSFLLDDLVIFIAGHGSGGRFHLRPFGFGPSRGIHAAPGGHQRGGSTAACQRPLFRLFLNRWVLFTRELVYLFACLVVCFVDVFCLRACLLACLVN